MSRGRLPIFVSFLFAICVTLMYLTVILPLSVFGYTFCLSAIRLGVCWYHLLIDVSSYSHPSSVQQRLQMSFHHMRISSCSDAQAYDLATFRLTRYLQPFALSLTPYYPTLASAFSHMHSSGFLCSDQILPITVQFVLHFRSLCFFHCRFCIATLRVFTPSKLSSHNLLIHMIDRSLYPLFNLVISVSVFVLSFHYGVVGALSTSSFSVVR